eukprot:Nk52_evm16s348 gene=Nk52_evmTU16s348
MKYDMGTEEDARPWVMSRTKEPPKEQKNEQNGDTDLDSSEVAFENLVEESAEVRNTLITQEKITSALSVGGVSYAPSKKHYSLLRFSLCLDRDINYNRIEHRRVHHLPLYKSQLYELLGEADLPELLSDAFKDFIEINVCFGLFDVSTHRWWNQVLYKKGMQSPTPSPPPQPQSHPATEEASRAAPTTVDSSADEETMQETEKKSSLKVYRELQIKAAEIAEPGSDSEPPQTLFAHLKGADPAKKILGVESECDEEEEDEQCGIKAQDLFHSHDAPDSKAIQYFIKSANNMQTTLKLNDKDPNADSNDPEVPDRDIFRPGEKDYRHMLSIITDDFWRSERGFPCCNCYASLQEALAEAQYSN